MTRIPGSPIGANTMSLAVSPVISAAAYTAGQTIGPVMQLTGMVLEGPNSGVLQSLRVTDKAKQNAAIDIIFFSAVLGTPFADRVTFAPAAADLPKLLGHVSIASSDYSQFSANSIATRLNVGLGIVLAAASTTLFCQAVSRGTPTYASVSDLEFLFLMLQD